MKTKLNLIAVGMLLAAGTGQPVITQQPHSCTNPVGTTVTFTVQAMGTQPLAYQWQRLDRVSDECDASGEFAHGRCGRLLPDHWTITKSNKVRR